MSASNQSPYTLVGNSGALVLTNVQTSEAGYYFVVVTYLSGGNQQTLTSSTLSLVVNLQPAILVQPVSVTTANGSNAVFNVAVAGEPPLHLQWQLNGANLTDNGHLTGSATTNLLIQNLTPADAGNYDVLVANRYGSVTSLVATLQVVLAPPVITSPTNAVGKQGYAFNYVITTTGATPIEFGAPGLPEGVELNSTNGVISGVPAVAGVFDITLFATNAAGMTSEDLVLTLANDIPGLTSATNAVGQQGASFSYLITATNDPAWFGASALPDGLAVDPGTGLISGVPLVSGSFPITLTVTNEYGSDTETLTLNLVSGAPVITSPLAQNGMQGQSLAYTITALNHATSFSAEPLPPGLNLNPANGSISGVPLVSGSNTVTIGAVNEFGSTSQTLVLNLASGAPGITSRLTAIGLEQQPAFIYTIRASNSPTAFWASALPTGLTVNTNTGVITGSPLYAGNYNVPLFAANAWGVGMATLQLDITNVSITGLVIANVKTNYQSPYLVEFTFSLVDNTNPLTMEPIVASPDLMAVTAFEDGAAVSPSETSVILQNVGAQTVGTLAAKVNQGYLVLDFSESIAALPYGETNGNGLSPAAAAEIASAQTFVNSQPAGSQIGVYEFHRDDEAPQQVLPLTTDKTVLNNAIAGIWTNYVQGFPSGSRVWDALTSAISALGPANSNANHYILLMSDGQDDSSTATMETVITAATNASVQIDALGIGDDLDTSALQAITGATLGQFITTTNLSELALDFAQFGKDLSSQYILRWATLSRASKPFVPSFEISYQGLDAYSPPNPDPIITGTYYVIDTNTVPATTNDIPIYTTNYIMLPYTPTAFAGNILGGSLVLSANTNVSPLQITLNAVYVPRYIRQLHLHYRANWPMTVSLDSTNPGEILAGWSLTQTNDGAGGEWALLSAPDPSLLADSLQFATFGDLLTFSFHDSVTASNAFSLFAVDNTIYSSVGTNFYGFTLKNTNAFVTSYAVPPAHGTPIPWLISYGFTTNFAAAELLDPNGSGLTVWQDYLAGLDPLTPHSGFDVQIGTSQNAPQIGFSTVANRTYRIDWADTLDGDWFVLRDGIAGTGGEMTFTDLRNLSSVETMYYRVVVEDP
jgi:PKD repeat protein